MFRSATVIAIGLLFGLMAAGPGCVRAETPFQSGPQVTAARASNVAQGPHSALTRLRQPESSAPASAPAEATVDTAAMLQPMNEIRTNLGRKPLVWSNALAQEAGVISKAGASDCSYSSARKAVGSSSAIFYWAPGIRRVDGASLAQNLSAAFVVSEWKSGGEDYNAGAGECRRAGACTTFSKLAGPQATAAGCAREVCPNQSQIWVCRISGD